MTAIEDARALREHALAARASRQKAGIGYDSIQVPIDTILTLTAPPTDDEREALEDVAWEVLEPRLEDVIRLDLNDPDDSILMRGLVSQVATAYHAAGFRRQGPITDAQVKAAWVSLNNGISTYVGRDQARAALEAARDA